MQNITMQSQYYFNIEDTSEGCYRDFISALLKKGWISGSNRSKKHDPKRFRKAIENNPYLLWTIQEKNINFTQLNPIHIVNHFEGITQLTTKMGFCEILRDMVYCCVDCYDVSPRCYNLGDPAHREEFIDDFTLSAAINILKCSTVHPTSAILQKRESILQNALFACSRFLRIKARGEWPGVERTFKYFESFGLFGLSPQDWDSLLQLSYELSEYNYIFSISSIYEELINNYQKLSPLQIKIRLLLISYSSLSCTQFYINGNKNIWILKAPEACRGVGMRILHTLHDILDCERGMSSRIAQKYIETPLLAPLYQSSSNPPILMKFDLRIWVLVTSFQPLTAYIYSIVYGRRCGAAYNDRVETLNNNLIHLSNYSIQKNFTTDDTPSSGTTTTTSTTQAADDNTTNLKNKLLQGSTSTSRTKSKSNLVQKLRSKLDTNRPPNKRNLKLSKEDLLLTHYDIIEIIGDFSGEDGELLWSTEIWPSICCKIFNILEAAAATVTHRPRSFEFLGFDILLDDKLTPWVLEVNMSPAIAHRGARHDSIIRTMAESLINIVVDPIITEHMKSILKTTADNQYTTTATTTTTTTDSTTNTTIAPDDNNIIECIGEWLPLVPSYHTNNNRFNSTTTTDDFFSTTTTTTTTTTNYNNNNGSDVNISLLAVGKSINNNQIQFTDYCCSGFLAVLQIQKWSRKMLVRTRQFHHKRKIAVTKLQCWCRIQISKHILQCLKERFYSIIIQSIYRQFRAKKHLCYLMQSKAAISIQCQIRIYLAKKKKRQLFKIWNATKIQLFIRASNLHKRMLAMKIFLRYMRRFLATKKYYRRKIKCIISLHYKMRKRRSKIIQRVARRFLVRLHLQQIMERKEREKELNLMFQEEMQQKQWEHHQATLVLKEQQLMSVEDEAMHVYHDLIKKNEEMNVLMQTLFRNSNSNSNNIDSNNNDDTNDRNIDNSNNINAIDVPHSAVNVLGELNRDEYELSKRNNDFLLSVIDNSINNNDDTNNISNNTPNNSNNNDSSSRHTKRRHPSKKHRSPSSTHTSNTPPQRVDDEEPDDSLNNNHPYNNNNQNAYENEYPPNNFYYSTNNITSTNNTIPEFTTEAWDSSVSNDLLDFIRKHDASKTRRIFKPVPTTSHSSNNLLITDFHQSKEPKKHNSNNSNNNLMNKSNSISNLNIQNNNNNSLSSTNSINNKENQKSRKSKNSQPLPRRYDNSILDPFSSTSSDAESLSSSSHSDSNNDIIMNNHNKNGSLDTSKFERRKKEIKYSSKKKEVINKSDNSIYQCSDNNASQKQNNYESYATATNASYNTSDNNGNDSFNNSRHSKNSFENITTDATVYNPNTTLMDLNISEIHCNTSQSLDEIHGNNSSIPVHPRSDASTSRSSTGNLRKSSHQRHDPSSNQADVLFEFPSSTQRATSTANINSQNKIISGNGIKDMNKLHERSHDRFQADIDVLQVVSALPGDSRINNGTTGSKDIQSTGGVRAHKTMEDCGWEKGATAYATTAATPLQKHNRSHSTHPATATPTASGDTTNTTRWKQAARGDGPGSTKGSQPSEPSHLDDKHHNRVVTSYSSEEQEQEQIRLLERQREHQHQLLMQRRDQYRQMTEQIDTSDHQQQQQESKKKNVLESYINIDKKNAKRPSSKSTKLSKKNNHDTTGNPMRPSTGKPSYALHNNEIDILLSSNFDPLYKQLMNFPAAKKDTPDKTEKSAININDNNVDYFTPSSLNNAMVNTPPKSISKNTGTDNIHERNYNTTTTNASKTLIAVGKSEDTSRTDNINKLLKTVEDSNRKFLQSLNCNNNNTATTTSNTALLEKVTGNRPLSACSVRSTLPTARSNTTTTTTVNTSADTPGLHYPDRKSIIESLLTQVDQSISQSKETFLSVTPHHSNASPHQIRTTPSPPPPLTPSSSSSNYKRPDNTSNRSRPITSSGHLLTSSGIIKSLSTYDPDDSHGGRNHTISEPLKNELAEATSEYNRKDNKRKDSINLLLRSIFNNQPTQNLIIKNQNHIKDIDTIYTGVDLYPTCYPSSPLSSKSNNRRRGTPPSTLIIKSLAPNINANISINNNSNEHEAPSQLLSNSIRAELVKESLQSVNETSKMRIKSHLDEYTPKSNQHLKPTTRTPSSFTKTNIDHTNAVQGLVNDTAPQKVKIVLNGLTAEDITDLDWDF